MNCHYYNIQILRGDSITIFSSTLESGATHNKSALKFQPRRVFTRHIHGRYNNTFDITIM